MPSSHHTRSPRQWCSALAAALDPRSAPRLALLLLGAVLARGRRTVTAWVRAAGLGLQFRRCYDTVAAAGGRTDAVAARLLHNVLRPLTAGMPRLVFAIDDTPTPRYGPTVQGAGVHHNPTPGPAGAPFLYGHVWVVLALLADHPTWGTIAMPLLARLYVRLKDLPAIPGRARPAFRTKLELAVELMRWAVAWAGFLGKPLWLVADGAYATADVLKPLAALDVTVVSRLRTNARLQSLPAPRRPGQRGRPRVYGESRIELAKRAGQRRGWRSGVFHLYGVPTAKRYKTFLATWRPAGGVIRVVLVDEPDRGGWRAYFCTDPAASVADVLELVARRFAVETAFKDCKGVVGAGEQQVRRVGTNVGAFHVCLWSFTLTEAWAWTKAEADLVGHRGASPWDRRPRRPSHADKRRALRRELLGEELRRVLPAGPNEAEMAAVAERLLDMAA